MLRGVIGCLSDQAVQAGGGGWGGGGRRRGTTLTTRYVVVGGYRGRKLRSGFTKSIMHINKYALYYP